MERRVDLELLGVKVCGNSFRLVISLFSSITTMLPRRALRNPDEVPAHDGNLHVEPSEAPAAMAQGAPVAPPVSEARALLQALQGFFQMQ